jgi:hypothetical protein
VLQARTRQLLSIGRLPWALALMAVLLVLPALKGGLCADDYFHRVVLLDRGPVGAATEPIADLFAFVPERLHGWMTEQGLLAWWSDPDLHISFARPLTALTHVLDYRLWPDSPVLQHAHNLAWFALAVGLVATLYRRVHGAGLVAGLAGLLFAVEDAHALSAGWLAGRNTVLCLVFGAILVRLHVTWRATHELRPFLLSLLALGCGLGFGEATLGGMAYVVAWQATREDGSRLRRLLPLIPHALIVTMWRVLYGALGYGVRGSTLYVDPGAQPLLFLGALVERGPVLLAAQWLQTPSDLWSVLPRSGQITASAVCALVVVGVLALLWRLLSTRAVARFWALGMVLSLIPVCAAFPMDRLLTFSGIGAFALMAMLCEACGVWLWAPAGPATWRGRTAGLLVALHLPMAALLLVLRVLAIPAWAELLAAAARDAPRGPEVAQRTFIFVNGNDFPVFYTAMVRMATGEAPAPRRMALLAPMMTPKDVWREDERTLVITAREGYLALAIDRLLVSPGRRFCVGQTFARPDFVAEVRTVTEDGRPQQVAFRFRQPLEAPEYCWLRWKRNRVVPFTLPAPGDRKAIGIPQQ